MKMECKVFLEHILNIYLFNIWDQIYFYVIFRDKLKAGSFLAEIILGSVEIQPSCLKSIMGKKGELNIVEKSHEYLWRVAAEKIFEKHLHTQRFTGIFCFLSPFFLHSTTF